MCRKTHARIQRARLAVRGLTANEGDVDPVVPFGCRVDELSELRPYPWRQGGCLDASPARYTARAMAADEIGLPDRRMRLLEMVNLADMGDFKRDALAMPAGRETQTLDHRHLVRHSGMARIVGDRVDAGLGTIWPGLYSCAMVMLRIKLINDF